MDGDACNAIGDVLKLERFLKARREKHKPSIHRWWFRVYVL